MAAAEPKYLGRVRFGAGAGCPCLEPGERLLTVRKHQHKHVAATGSGIWAGPKQNFLLEESSGPLWDAHPEVGYDPVFIRQQLDRHTGLLSGPRVLWPQGDPYYLVDRFDSRGAIFRHAFNPDWGEGAIILQDAYTLGMLRDDIDAVIGTPTAGIGSVPWGGHGISGYHELAKGTNDYRADGTAAAGSGQRSWLGLGALTGQPGGVIVEREQQVLTGGGIAFVLQSVLEWGIGMSRQVAQIRYRGRFSTEEFYRVHLGGQEVGDEVVLGRTYWEILRGILQVQSPPISDADGDATDYRFHRGYRVRLGDTDPSGNPPLEWVGIGAPAGGC